MCLLLTSLPKPETVESFPQGPLWDTIMNESFDKQEEEGLDVSEEPQSPSWRRHRFLETQEWQGTLCSLPEHSLEQVGRAGNVHRKYLTIPGLCYQRT